MMQSKTLQCAIHLLIFFFILCFGGALAIHLQSTSPLSPDLSQIMQSPSFSHILGTDQLGHDYLSLYLIAGSISIGFAILTATLCTFIGLTLAIFSAYKQGNAEKIILRLTDIFIALPLIPFLAIFVTMDFSKIGISPEMLAHPLSNLFKIMIIFSLVGWIQVTRSLRGAILKIRHADYVIAAKAMGMKDIHIIIHHILPNILPTLFIGFNLLVAQLILFEATLSYLGFGIRPPFPSWGSLLINASPFYDQNKLQAFLPGISITVTVFLFFTIGRTLSLYLSKRKSWL